MDTIGYNTNTMFCKIHMFTIHQILRRHLYEIKKNIHEFQNILIFMGLHKKIRDKNEVFREAAHTEMWDIHICTDCDRE